MRIPEWLAGDRLVFTVMGALISVLTLVLLSTSGCGKKGTKDQRSAATSDLQVCHITSGQITCGKSTYNIEPTTCEPEIVEKIVEKVVEKEVIVTVEVEKETDSSAEPDPEEPMPVDDTADTAEPTDPVVVVYHGTVCNDLPIATIGETYFVVYQDQFQEIPVDSWAVVWETSNLKGKPSGCYVKLTPEGQIKSRYRP